MSETHIQEHETQEPIIVPEGTTITPKPALVESELEQTLVKTTEETTVTATATTITTTETAAAAVVVAKPSRLSAAFKAVSCGLCIHPWKNSNPTDYHTLVVTPTDEDGPLLGEDHHDADHGSSGKAVTEDFKELHISDVGASSSAEYHQSSLDVETKAVEQEVTSTFVEEITVFDGSALQTSEITEIREVQQQPEEAQAIVAAVIDAHPSASPVSPSNRTSSPFAKLVKRSSIANNAPPANASPLFGRLGRFAKIIRTHETKVESSKVAPTPESIVEDAKSTSVLAAESSDVAVVDLGDISVAKQDYHVEIQETVVDDHHETDILTEEPSELEVESLVVDTSVATSKPVAIPGQSPNTPTSWAQSPTLHQNDISINSSLAKVGRTSTSGSETGSMGSSEIQNSPSMGRDSGIAELSKKRKNSVLKKIGKAIKNSKDKVDKRLSRQGSLALDSPIEADENNVH
ncbi:hypothetical protein BGX21_001720 [Mortierella sp. AD011]|nr:hypothetical protein BGX20_001629 [Mortierella sp. AD010]KAF9382842.1 hypothetical protein BGX21_001720 [Mortierella sp. AD011]